MDESLGSGFDSIRAAVMSPTSFPTRVTVSSVFTQTITSLESPSSLMHLAGVESLVDSAQTDLYSRSTHVRTESRDTVPVTRSRETFHSDQSTSSGELTHGGLHDIESFTGSDQSYRHMAGSAEYGTRGMELNVEKDIDSHHNAEYDMLGYDFPSPQSASDDYESDPDDTRKFYTELESYSTVGGDYYDSEDSEDCETNGDYDSSHTGQIMASISRHDHRFHSHWNVEQYELANNHFEAPLQTKERNLTVDEFIKRWLHATLSNSPNVPSQFPGPSLEAANASDWLRPERIVRPDTIDFDEFYDIQQIPWREKLNVRREDARILRDAWYYPYTNLDFPRNKHSRTLPKFEHYFREKALYPGFKATIEHFQLRNLMSVTSFNTVQFAHESKLLSWTPDYKHVRCIMDLTRPPVETGFEGAVKISSMKAKLGVSVTGGFTGEYCMNVNGSQSENTYGFVTKDANGITNNIDIVQSRTHSSPLIIFASNDQHIRVLNCANNQFIADHELPIPVNCSETSPDNRLRIVVGDSTESFVLEADTGRTLRQLPGHHDFGFACAWSPDMLHIATSNQDRTVNIWDVRMWRLLQTMNADRSCYRSLRFSPIGGGPRTLLMSEPADRISIVNATTYESRQVHDFFGEIAGADYTPDGGSIWVANADETFGGFMRYDRMQYGLKYASSGSSSRSHDISTYEEDERTKFAPGWYSNLPHEWIDEDGLEKDSRSVIGQRERDFRFSNGLSDEARDDLLI